MLENTVSGEKLTVKTDDNGDAVFSLCFDSSDAGKIYSYRLSEINGGIRGVTYDTKVHDISIAVVLDEENKLIANVVMNGNATENPIAEFTNTYHGKISEPPPTGDNNMKFWIIIMMISGAFYIFLAIIERHIVSQRINIYKKDNMSKF
jgi:pilin isopeptide linkage protein